MNERWLYEALFLPLAIGNRFKVDIYILYKSRALVEAVRLVVVVGCDDRLGSDQTMCW